MLKKIRTLTILAITLLGVFALAQPLPALAQFGGNSSSTEEFATSFDGVEVTYGSCGINPICHFTVALKMIITSLLLMIGGWFAQVFTIFTGFARAMIVFGTQLTNLDIVTKGFAITRNLANVFFVAAIIFAAIVTIIKSESFNGKKILRNLIIAVVLINFSFLFAGIILDLANVFTAGFARNFDANSIGKAFQPQQIILATTGVKPGDNLGEAGWVTENYRNQSIKFGINDNDTGWALMVKLWQGLLFSVVITFLLMLTMIAIAIGLLVRNVAICVLLILMPLAWALWALPISQLKAGYDLKTWFSKFIEKAIYLPTVTFFIWLTVSTSAAMFAPGGSLLTNAKTIADSIGVDSFFIVLFQQLIIIGFLVGGLKAASGGSKIAAMFGIGAAALVAGKITGAGKKLTKATVGRAVDLGKATAVAGVRGAGSLVGGGLNLAGKQLTDVSMKGVKKGGVLGKVGGGLGAIIGTGVLRGAGVVAEGATGLATGQPSKVGKAVDTFTKNLKEKGASYVDPREYFGKSQEEKFKAIQEKSRKAADNLKGIDDPDELIRLAKEADKSGAPEQLALLRKLQDKKLLGNLSAAELKPLLDSALAGGSTETYNNAKKAAMNARPELVPELTAGDAKYKDYAGLSNEAKIQKYIDSMSGDDLGKMKFDKLDKAIQEQIAKSLARLPHIASKFNSSSQSVDGIKALVDKLIAIVGDATVLNKPSVDVRKNFNAMIATAGNNTAKVNEIKEKLGAYDALLRLTQTVG